MSGCLSYGYEYSHSEMALEAYRDYFKLVCIDHVVIALEVCLI